MLHKGVALISQFHARSHAFITFYVAIKHKIFINCKFEVICLVMSLWADSKSAIKNIAFLATFLSVLLQWVHTRFTLVTHQHLYHESTSTWYLFTWSRRSFTFFILMLWCYENNSNLGFYFLTLWHYENNCNLILWKQFQFDTWETKIILQKNHVFK